MRWRGILITGVKGSVAILIPDKIGLKVASQEEAHQLFALLAGDVYRDVA